ncbi:MAG: hypothetical protein HYW22_00910 [Candidatus Aenigmarchaeota archaeon]|nr:hypothetical protein [Candidatus Aenigmarchaeota archaeon]
MMFPISYSRRIPDEEVTEETFFRLFDRGPPEVIYSDGQRYRAISYKPENDERFFGGLVRISTAVYRKML